MDFREFKADYPVLFPDQACLRRFVDVDFDRFTWFQVQDVGYVLDRGVLSRRDASLDSVRS
jgi:hypothetical protein